MDKKSTFFPSLYFFTIIILLSSLFVDTFAQKKKMKRYLFEHAYVEKTVEVKNQMMETITTKKIYITEFGNSEAHYINEKQNIKMANIVQENNSVSITNGEWIINYDPATKQGTKIKNTFYDKFAGLSEDDLKKMSEDMSEALNTDVKEIGEEKIAGKLCKIVEATTNMSGLKNKTKMWMYKNFAMKTESEGMGLTTVELVKVFKEGEKPDQKILTVPSDINIVEVKNPFNK